MGLAEIREILKRLSTDEELRARFVGDPFRTGRELGLSARESRRLGREAAARLDSLASSPGERRLVEMGKLLPLTKRVLGGRFTSHFNRYAATHEPGGIERLFGDALDFADYLEQKLCEEHAVAGWTLDLLRYEKARLKAADPARRLTVAYFRHDISRLVRSVARREEPPAAHRRLTVAAWWRPRPHATVRYHAFTAPQLFARGT